MTDESRYPKVAQLRDVAALRAWLNELGVTLPLDEQVQSAAEGSPMAWPIEIGPYRVGNRWCIHPMEGWDCNLDGSPSPLAVRRWQNFGRSGAKLIWGGEAAAVRHDGRANPNQLLAVAENRAGLSVLLHQLRQTHRAEVGDDADLLVGLQLTHSGRFSKPNDHRRSEPRIAYHHPLLDAKFPIDPQNDAVVWTDDELERLIDDYVRAAVLAGEVGFQFVDVKACHGYLLHEFLSARMRAGRFGGDLSGRSRVLRTIVGRIRQEAPRLLIGVRLSVFDFVPYRTSREVGQPMEFDQSQPYLWAFGTAEDNPLAIDLTEPLQLMKLLVADGVSLLNLSCGSPYYNPHIQRPAIFPPSDGYQPPEDPLVGVARQIEVVRRCKNAVSEVPLVGSGYSYLQEFLPQVAQAAVREAWVDFVGLGRMVLSYPRLPADVLAGRSLQRKRICRTFSDCTTAPRHGLVSGCYPLDDFYKQLPERSALLEVKQQLRD